MITGDQHSTAIAVAKDIGMVKPEAEILLIDAAPQLKARPPELSDAEQDAAGLQPLVSTPSAKTRVHFDIDEQQVPADEELSASTPAGERHTPPALVDRGQSPAALFDEGLAPDALDVEGPQPACLNGQGQMSAGLIGQQHGQPQGQLSSGLIDDWQQPAACISQGQLAAGLVHTGQPPTAPDAVSAAPPTSCSRSIDTSQASSFPNVSLAEPLAATVEPQAPTAEPLTSSADPSKGLSLTGHTDQRSYSVAQALTAMAEGHLQCAVTGAAFDHLLQHAPMSMIETVMRTAVVFARMKPHQKGQVMGLLGSAGLHHNFHGQSRHLLVSIHLGM